MQKVIKHGTSANIYIYIYIICIWTVCCINPHTLHRAFVCSLCTLYIDIFTQVLYTVHRYTMYTYKYIYSLKVYIKYTVHTVHTYVLLGFMYCTQYKYIHFLRVYIQYSIHTVQTYILLRFIYSQLYTLYIHIFS